MALKDQQDRWEHLEHREVLCQGSGHLHFFLRPPPQLLQFYPRSPRLQAPARPRHPARVMDLLHRPTGVCHRDKRPALLQTHNRKVLGTDWAPSRAPWDLVVGWREGTAPPAQEKQLLLNSKQ